MADPYGLQGLSLAEPGLEGLSFAPPQQSVQEQVRRIMAQRAAAQQLAQQQAADQQLIAQSQQVQAIPQSPIAPTVATPTAAPPTPAPVAAPSTAPGLPPPDDGWLGNAWNAVKQSFAAAGTDIAAGAATASGDTALLAKLAKSQQAAEKEAPAPLQAFRKASQEPSGSLWTDLSNTAKAAVEHPQGAVDAALGVVTGFVPMIAGTVAGGAAGSVVPFVGNLAGAAGGAALTSAEMELGGKALQHLRAAAVKAKVDLDDDQAVAKWLKDGGAEEVFGPAWKAAATTGAITLLTMGVAGKLGLRADKLAQSLQADAAVGAGRASLLPGVATEATLRQGLRRATAGELGTVLGGFGAASALADLAAGDEVNARDVMENALTLLIPGGAHAAGRYKGIRQAGKFDEIKPEVAAKAATETGTADTELSEADLLALAAARTPPETQAAPTPSAPPAAPPDLNALYERMGVAPLDTKDGVRSELGELPRLGVKANAAIDAVAAAPTLEEKIAALRQFTEVTTSPKATEAADALIKKLEGQSAPEEATRAMLEPRDTEDAVTALSLVQDIAKEVQSEIVTEAQDQVRSEIAARQAERAAAAAAASQDRLGPISPLAAGAVRRLRRGAAAAERSEPPSDAAVLPVAGGEDQVRSTGGTGTGLGQEVADAGAALESQRGQQAGDTGGNQQATAAGPVVPPSDAGGARPAGTEPTVVGFQTAKGSTYVVHDDGTTTRNKSFHPEHGAADQGPQERSQQTFYVDNDRVNQLAEIQTQGAPLRAIVVSSTGHAAIKYLAGPHTGKIEGRTVTKVHTEPAVGLTPVELWNDGKSVHFGNRITKVEKPTPVVEAPKAAGTEPQVRKLNDAYYIRYMTDEMGFDAKTAREEYAADPEHWRSEVEDAKRAEGEGRQAGTALSEKEAEQLGEAPVGDELNNIEPALDRAQERNGTPDPQQVRTLSLLKRIQRMYIDGRMRVEDVITDVHDLITQLEQRNDARLFKEARKGLRRGPEWVRAKVERAVADGEMDRSEADFVHWLLNKSPQLANDLAISLRTQPDHANTSGTYSPAGRLLTYFIGGKGEHTAVHEIMHHVERMLPPDVQRGILDQYTQAWSKAFREGSDIQRRVLLDMISAAHGDKAAETRVNTAFRGGVMKSAEHYQFTSPSEFWAVNAARLLSARHEAGSWVGKARQWVKEFIEKIKDLFGKDSNAGIIRALNAAMKSNGEFVSKRMLVDQSAFRNIELGHEPQQDLLHNTPHSVIKGSDSGGLRQSVAYHRGNGTYDYYKTTAEEPRGDPETKVPGLTRAEIFQRMAADGHRPAYAKGADWDKAPATTKSALQGWKDGSLQFLAHAIKGEDGKPTGAWKITEGADIQDKASPTTQRMVENYDAMLAARNGGNFTKTKRQSEALAKQLAAEANPTLKYRPPGQVGLTMADRENPLKYLGQQAKVQAEAAGRTLPESQRPDLANTRKISAIDNDVEKLQHERVKPLEKEGRKLLSRFKRNGEEFDKDITALAYLDRSTNMLADARYDASPDLEQLVRIQQDAARQHLDALPADYRAALEAYAKKWKAVSDAMLDYKAKNGLIPQAEATRIKNAQTFYVPMRTDLKSTVGKRATGASDESTHPLLRIVSDWHNAIKQNYENREALATYELAENHNIVLPDGSKLFDLAPLLEYKVDPDTGDVIRAVEPLTMDKNSVTVLRDGKPYRMRVNDPDFNAALQRVPANDTHRAINTAMHGMAMFNALYGGLKTAASPVFAVKNVMRDVPTAFAQADQRVSRRELAKSLVRPYVWAAAIQNAAEPWTGKRGGAFEQAAQQAGAYISRRGQYGLQSHIDQPRINLDPSLLQRGGDLRRGLFSFEHGKVMNVLTFATKLGENITRGAVFDAATRSPRLWQSVGRDNGMNGAAVETALRKASAGQPVTPVERTLVNHLLHEAGVSAKTATVNFEPKGRASGLMNALYVFSNAKVQGARTYAERMGFTGIKGGDTMLQRLKLGNRYTQGATAAALGAGMATAFFGYKNDPEKYSQLSDMQKDDYLIFKSGGFSPPIPQEIGWSYILGQSLVDAKMNPRWADPPTRQAKAATRFGTGVMQSFWPGGSSMSDPVGGAQGVTSQYVKRLFEPTLATPLLDIASNQNTFGSQIVHGLNDKGVPANGKPLYVNNADRVSPLARGATSVLHKAGVMDAAPESAQYLINQYFKTQIDAAHIAPTWEAFDAIFGKAPTELDGKERPNAFMRTFFQTASPLATKNDLEEIKQHEVAKAYDAGDPKSPTVNMLKRGEVQAKAAFTGQEKMTPEQRQRAAERAETIRGNTLKKYRDLQTP